MSDQNDVLTQIRVAMGKIEVTTSNTEHRVKNIEQRLGTVVHGKELEPLARRIEVLEAFQVWIQRALIGILFTAMTAAIVATKKFGI